MPTAATPKIDTAQAEAPAEKAYAAAAEKAEVKAAAEAPKAAAPAPVQPAAPVTAPVAAKPAPVAKPAPAKKLAAKKAPVKKAVVKAAPKKATAKKPAAKKAPAVKKLTKAPAKKAALKTKPAAIKSAAPTVTKLKDTIMTKTQTTADAFTTRVKDTVAEAQTRAKAGYDKATALAADMNELNKGNLEAFVEAGKVLAAGLQDLGKDAVAQGKTAFETMTADVKELAAVKSPTDFFKLQGEIARRNFDAVVAVGSKRSETLVKLANDAFAPLSSRFSVAVEKIKQAA